MQTVIETPAFLASAFDEGISDAERAGIVSFMAANPSAGDMIVGSGGARKVRFAGRGKGKSGGYRVITFFADKDIPVFLLDVYSRPICPGRNATNFGRY
jgi:mRNA-degrading endonuclease RelE of RelBE toxin-antitoxin system